ncbi:MAG: SUF system NifU family Fe-S cluster assembly protein [Trueperaceae bacterium]|nr:MAG: SUF system NifU family Fe-S cluster assembly protein [Trueperaceae bacterium]
MSILESLYKEIILDHYRSPRNRGKLASATIQLEGLNPSCGDELELYLDLEKETIVDVKFTGEGCAISQASASMMTEVIKGKSREDALELSRKFKAMIQGEGVSEELGDLTLLQGISKLHARVKCATLAWITLDQALAKDESES